MCRHDGKWKRTREHNFSALSEPVHGYAEMVHFLIFGSNVHPHSPDVFEQLARDS